MGHGTWPGFSAGGTVLPWALAGMEGAEILPAAEVTCLQNGWCWRKAKGFDQRVIEMWWSKGLNLLSPGSPTHWDVQSNPCCVLPAPASLRRWKRTKAAGFY